VKPLIEQMTKEATKKRRQARIPDGSYFNPLIIEDSWISVEARDLKAGDVFRHGGTEHVVAMIVTPESPSRFDRLDVITSTMLIPMNATTLLEVQRHRVVPGM